MQKQKRFNPALYAAAKLDKAHTDGIFEGFTATISLALIAAYNVFDLYMDGQEFSAFFRAWEAEVRRIFREECHGDPTEIADAIEIGTEDLRRRLGIDADPS